MISFASVDRFEGEFAILEVELVEAKVGETISYMQKDTTMMDIPRCKLIGEPKEGDIFIVEHDGSEISRLICKDEDEKQRRIEFLKSILTRK